MDEKIKLYFILDLIKLQTWYTLNTFHGNITGNGV